MACDDTCCGSSADLDQRDPSAHVAPLTLAESSIANTPTENGNDCCQTAVSSVDEMTTTSSKPDGCCAPSNVATAGPCDDQGQCDTRNIQDQTRASGSCAGESSGYQKTTTLILSAAEAGEVASESAPVASCCSVDATARSDDSGRCCSPKAANAEKAGSCCGGGPIPQVKKDKCCSSSEAPAAEASCCQPDQKTPCVSDSAAAEEPVPECCQGKTSPCCDEACIERIALRECQSSAKGSMTTAVGTGCDQGKDGKPCSSHSRSARSRYQSRLEALGCICRALIARGQESCCARVSKKSAASSRPSSFKSRSSASVRSFCGKDADKPRVLISNTGLRRCEQSALPSRTSLGCSKGCCSPKVQTRTEAKGCKDDCCDPKDTVTRLSPTSRATNTVGYSDIEKRNDSGKEHVVIAISGMTCTGCETKLQRTLGNLKPVVNLKTSLILSRVEFDLDQGDLSPEDVIRHLERTTEFKCDRINTLTSTLDLVCDRNASEIVDGPWPNGVTDVKRIDKGAIIRVDFDSTLVGARDLIEKGWDRPMILAPSILDPGLEASSKHVRQMGLMTLLSICLTIPVLVMSWAPLPHRELAYSSASLALATIVQFVIAGPFYPKALKSLLFSRIIEMDLLIVLSTSAAYIFSVVSFGYLAAGHPLSTGEFFETSTLLVTLIMVGRYVAALARQKAVESISIRSLQTSTATLTDGSGIEQQIDTRLLQLGDVFKVAPDSKVPTDGTVISGHSEVDESMLTGESIPVEKRPGSVVIAGSINGSGALTVRLTRLPEHNTISTIASMVDEAKLSKPKIQQFADQVASYFVPVIIALTIVTFVIWIAVGVAVRNQSGQGATIRAVTYAITVLIVSCPCAIGLAVPMVIVISTGMAAERGIIFKSSQSIELAYRTSHVVFDKTGTLTAGKLTVCAEEFFGDDVTSTMSILLGLICDNKHPVSVAVASHLKDKTAAAVKVPDAKVLAGKGVEGTYLGKALRAGQSRWLDLATKPEVQNVLSAGNTVFCFTVDGTCAAVFGLRDEVRPDAIATISELKSRGIGVHVLSGDDEGAVTGVTATLDVPTENVRSRCSPADKQAYIKTLTASTPDPSGKTKKPVVIFCGDGTNDAVALAGATIGIHMNGGTDVAQSAADVVLVRPDLGRILTVIALSRKSIHRIAFNFGWSFVYNLFAILLASGAFVNARIPPEYAGLGELASVLPVIAAAALLRWSKI